MTNGLVHTDLAISERSRLNACESRIEKGLSTFIEVGTALLEIRDSRLYRGTHSTFENYCRDRWGMSRIHAYRMIDAAIVVENVLPMGNIPTTERQARHLAHLEPEMQREVWHDLTETLQPAEITAKIIEQRVQEAAALNQAVRQVKAEQADTLRPPGARVAIGDKEILAAAKEIRNTTAQEKRAERVDRINQISNGNTPLQTEKTYPVIYADPPWQYDHQVTESRAIENQYPTMTVEAICKLPVSELASPDAVLFLWTTSPKLPQGLTVIKAWGFEYVTCAVWDKVNIGQGYYFRQQHELLLVAKRGNIPTPSVEARPTWSIYTEKRTGHSVKPIRFYEVIERMYPEFRKIELFSRAPRKEWDSWGNQANAA